MKELIKDAVEQDILEKGDVKVSSAGLFAVEDDEASVYAVEVLEHVYELDIDKHRARQLTEEMVEENDLIVTMTDGHKHAIINAYPEAEDKTFTLKELAYGEAGCEDEESLDIEDPYRGDREDYEACAAEIYEALKKAFDKMTAETEETA